MAHIRRATVADAINVAPRLRDADIQESMAAYGLHPLNILPRNVSQEKDVWAMVGDQGEIVGMFGVSPVATYGHLGIVWMVSTDDLWKYRRELVAWTPGWLDYLHSKHPLLGNHIDARNTTHIRWLERMGFSFLRTHPHFGIQRRPFHEFARLRSAPCAQQS